MRVLSGHFARSFIVRCVSLHHISSIFLKKIEASALEFRFATSFMLLSNTRLYDAVISATPGQGSCVRRVDGLVRADGLGFSSQRRFCVVLVILFALAAALLRTWGSRIWARAFVVRDSSICERRVGRWP